MSGRRAARRGPGERAGIEATEVVQAAVKVYAQAGLGALTMRAVAAELGVAPNSLYSHVQSKSDLVDAVMDAMLREIELPPETADWQEALFTLMSASRHVLLSHADLIPVLLARPTRGPNALRLGEATLRLIERSGLRGQAAADALRILLVYTFGFAAQQAPRDADPAGERRKAASRRAFEAAREHPRLRSLSGALAEHPDDVTFQTGLRWLIDGIAADRSPPGGG